MVTISPTSGTAGTTAAVADNAITLPSDWRSQGTNFLSPEKVTAVVTLPAQQVAGSDPIAFAYSGVNAVGTAVTGNTQVTVNWTTKSCLTSDTTPPTVTVPSDFIVEAAGPSGTLVTFSASATDAVGPANPAVTCLPASGSTFALGMTTVACSAEDTAGNMRDQHFQRDRRGHHSTAALGARQHAPSKPPGLTAPPPPSRQAPPMQSRRSLRSPASRPPVRPFPLGTSTVNCSATDAAGNKDAGSFTVTVQDTTAPALTLPANMTFEATGPDGATATFQASATDAVTADPRRSPASRHPVRPSPSGRRTVNCSAIDAAGNKATGSFTVSVQRHHRTRAGTPRRHRRSRRPDPPAPPCRSTRPPPTRWAPANPDVDLQPGIRFDLRPRDDAGQLLRHRRGGQQRPRGSFTVTVEDTTAPTITWLGGPQRRCVVRFRLGPCSRHLHRH